MKVVIQRVQSAAITVEHQKIATISKGLVILLGIHHEDTPKKANELIEKILSLRLFEDNDQKMALSIEEIKGELLVVSQFTLYADLNKGRRPSFDKAAKPELAITLYDHFVTTLKARYPHVQTGQFQAYMQVELINDGPVTFVYER